MSPPPAPVFLTPKELASRWRLGRSTIYELLSRGELPCYAIGGMLRVKLADVEAYEQAGYQPAVLRPPALRRKRRPAS